MRVSSRALGVIGTIGAVEALHALAQRSRGAVGDAARDAIRAIQAKLGPVDGGRISLATTDDLEGALSAAGGGELAVADDPGPAVRKPVR